MKKVDFKIGETLSDDYDLKESLTKNGDDVTHGDEVGPEKSTTYTEWGVINPQTELSCLYQN